MPTAFVSFEDYITEEERSETWREYFRGAVFPLEPATLRHQQIVAEIFGAMHSVLKGEGCRILFRGTRVCTGSEDFYAYPDLIAVCGTIQVSTTDPNTIANAKVLIEIASPTTKDYDLGTKYELYRGIPSLSEYLVVHEDQPFIEQHVKQPDGKWLLQDIRGMESTLQLETLPVSIPFSTIYPAD